MREKTGEEPELAKEKMVAAEQAGKEAVREEWHEIVTGLENARVATAALIAERPAATGRIYRTPALPHSRTMAPLLRARVASFWS